MATHSQNIVAEQRMRELLRSGGLPQPDRVECGFGCVRLFFDATKHVVVIDIDDPPDEAAEGSELDAA